MHTKQHVLCLTRALLQDGPSDEQPEARKGQPKKKKARVEPAQAEAAPAASDSDSELASEPGDRLSDVELGDEEDVFSPTAPEAEAPHKVCSLALPTLAKPCCYGWLLG